MNNFENTQEDPFKAKHEFEEAKLEQREKERISFSKEEEDFIALNDEDKKELKYQNPAKYYRLFYSIKNKQESVEQNSSDTDANTQDINIEKEMKNDPSWDLYGRFQK